MMNTSNQIVIDYNYLGGQENKIFHLSDYTLLGVENNITDYTDIISIVKLSIKKFENLDVVDYNNIDINIVFYIEVYEDNCIKKSRMNKVITSVIIPCENLKCNTVFELCEVNGNELFEPIFKKMLHNLMFKLSLKPMPIDSISKYKYVVFEEDSLNILMSIIFQYLQEIKATNEVISFDTDNEIICEILNLDDNQCENVSVLHNKAIGDINNNMMFSKIISLISDKTIDIENEDLLTVERLYNYSTIINFKNGGLNIVASLINKKNNTRYSSFAYCLNVSDVIESFMISKDKNALIVEINEDNCNVGN